MTRVGQGVGWMLLAKSQGPDDEGPCTQECLDVCPEKTRNQWRVLGS